MSTYASAYSGERASPDNLSLDSLFEPISQELAQTIALYRETLWNSADRSYIHELLNGESSYLPEEFRVPAADAISKHMLECDGKWIRASLVLLSADACGVRGTDVHQVAVAVELVHLATLVHDDIIDEAPIRRGLESIHWRWGNSIAVLFGDFLFSKAFKLLLSSGSIPSQQLLTQATGQMCLGEIKELFISDNGQTSEKEYLEMIENKTASLMASASASGAHIGQLNEHFVECMHAYGHAVGMAFQITDDVLDYTAPTKILGKEQGRDIQNGKSTLPLIHLVQNDGTAVHQLLSEDISFEEKTNQLRTMMNKLGSIDYAYSIATRYGEIAKKNLAEVEKQIGPTDSLTSLYNLVDFILVRER